MRYTNFAVISFSLFLTLGVLTASAIMIPFKIAIYGLIGCGLLFIFFWIKARGELVQNSFFGIFTYLMFFFIGVVDFQLHDPQNKSRHFSHFTSNENHSLIELRIVELLKSNPYYDNFITELIRIGESSVTGNALLQIRKDSTQYVIHTIDDRRLISAQISEIRPALNPNQFDYSNYLKTKKVYHQIRIQPRDLLQ